MKSSTSKVGFRFFKGFWFVVVYIPTWTKICLETVLRCRDESTLQFCKTQCFPFVFNILFYFKYFVLIGTSSEKFSQNPNYWWAINEGIIQLKWINTLQVNHSVPVLFQSRVDSSHAQIKPNVKFSLTVAPAVSASQQLIARIQRNPYVEVTASRMTMSAISRLLPVDVRWKWNQENAVSEEVHLVRWLRYAKKSVATTLGFYAPQCRITDSR